MKTVFFSSISLRRNPLGRLLVTTLLLLIAFGTTYIRGEASSPTSPSMAVEANDAITIRITAQVATVDDPDNILNGAVNINDVITGTYTFNSLTVDSNPLPTVGDYWHTTSPYGIIVCGGGFVFQTDPNDVDFLVEIVNDHNTPPRDNYLLRSYNNLPLANGATVDHIAWQLDDDTATALSSATLPSTPPNLLDWTSIFGLSLEGCEGLEGCDDPMNPRYFIRAHVTETAISSPATVIMVTTTTDELNNDGDCSLREAVQASNADTAVDACPAGSGDDTIILSADTYTLSIGGNSEDANAEGDLDVTGVLTIAGTGAATTIIQAGTSATNGIDRVLHILGSSNLTVQNVQIRYGRASHGAAPHIDGGGIYVADNSLLNVDNCTITYNWGANSGGVRSAPNTTVNINNSIISNNYSYSGGGGLGNYGTANIRNTTFNRNTAIFGGAISSAPNGTVDVANSTFSENSAIEFEWQPGYGAAGGAVYNYGEFNISNSTISGNTAINEAGGILNSGATHIKNCTITDNGAPTGGGVLDLGGIVTVTNSIVAANVGGDCGGAIVSSDYNIDSDNTCNLTKPNDQPSIDPMLDSLANNGGPTWTHALSPGSMAINTGDCSGGTITEDQRGVTRPQGYACDIGAYEHGGTIVYLPIVRKE